MNFICGAGHEFVITETENRDLWPIVKHLGDHAATSCRYVLENCEEVGCRVGGHEPGGHMGRFCGRESLVIRSSVAAAMPRAPRPPDAGGAVPS